MTESDTDNVPDAPSDNSVRSDNISAETVASLRRSVFGLGVIALLFGAGCALGVYFGIHYYSFESSLPPTRLQAKAARLVLIGIVEKGMMACAFGFLSRALFRYAGALKRLQDGHERDDAASLLTMQAACWRAATWLAWLYIGWELTREIVSTLW